MPLKNTWNYVHKGLLAILGVLIIATITALIFLGHTLLDLNRLITRGGNGVGKVLVLQDILGNVEEMQAAVRGYVISGDQSYVDSYNKTLKRIPVDMRTLNAPQEQVLSKSDIRHIQDLVGQELAVLQQVIDARTTQGYDTAQVLVAVHHNDTIMEQLRQQVTSISSTNLRNIGPQQRGAASEMKLALGVGTAMGVLVICACLAVLWYFQRAILKERALESSKNEFLSLASHQLRTPATNVKQYIGLLMDGYMGDLTDAQRRALEVAYRNNESEIKIMNDLLDVAKLDLQRIQLHKSVTNIVAIAREVVKNARPRADERNQKIELSAPNSLMANVDRTYIRGVIENLLDNGLKYSHPGTKVTITLGREQDMVCVSVRDKGLGIKKRDYGKLFNKFSRLNNEFSANSEGSGLGLYWVKQIVKLHGGNINVASLDGRGSEFSVYLPVR